MFAELIISSIIIPYCYELVRPHCFLLTGRLRRNTHPSYTWGTVFQCIGLQAIYLKTETCVENLVFGYFQAGSLSDVGSHNKRVDLDDIVEQFGKRCLHMVPDHQHP